MIDKRKIAIIRMDSKTCTRGILSPRSYAEVESLCDPIFFRWLFNDDTLQPFTLPKYYSVDWEQFLSELE